VLIFEHANTQAEETETTGPVDIRSARRMRDGGDVALITYGGSLHKTLAAADRLAALGIGAAVLDLRVLRPLDTAAIVALAQQCRRVVVIDEGWRSGSLAAEIIARIVECAFYELDAPPVRVCSEEVPVPYAQHLEEAVLPQPDRIVAAAQALLGGRG
jgi:pyruvate dehydrogenase E1 component beta subunit